MKRNLKGNLPKFYTHEGAPAARINATQQLRRLVLSCLLWEDTFYVDGISIADQIRDAADKEDVQKVMQLAAEARNRFHLRHVPLWLTVCALPRLSGRSGNAGAIAGVLQRPDEMGEILKLYWGDKKKPIPHSLKKGLALALAKFDAYQLSKYARQGDIRLRDILFLTHAKSEGERSELYKALAEDKLTAIEAGTWEARLSAGEDKKAVFTELLQEGKLGYLALLRNLRNMHQAGVEDIVVEAALKAGKGNHRVLPFRYVAAARACPHYVRAINDGLLAKVAGSHQFSGKNLILVDVSGSMDSPLSNKSDLMRYDAAAALAACFPGKADVYSFSNDLREVPNYGGLPGIEAIVTSQTHGGTELGKCLGQLNYGKGYDRVIVVTDEQSHDRVLQPQAKIGYMINVAAYQNGVGYGKWVHIDGFSEAIFRFMQEYESDV